MFSLTPPSFFFNPNYTLIPTHSQRSHRSRRTAASSQRAVWWKRWRLPSYKTTLISSHGPITWRRKDTAPLCAMCCFLWAYAMHNCTPEAWGDADQGLLHCFSCLCKWETGDLPGKNPLASRRAVNGRQGGSVDVLMNCLSSWMIMMMKDTINKSLWGLF